MKELIQKGWLRPGWINWLLLPISWIYRGVMALREMFYRSGLFSSHRLSVPVVVVGNISVGGTGKTPIVISLVEHLVKSGWRPGVIARGYGGRSVFWPRVVAKGDNAREVGDEPLVVFNRCKVPVSVGPERVRSAHLLVDRYDCNVIVSDDGFQHFALQRDVDIVVIDGERLFGNGWCIPAGPLREPIGALDRADLWVCNGSVQLATDYLQGEKCMIMGMEVGEVYQLDNPELCKSLTEFAHLPVRGVAGLGNPERFFNLLIQFGLQLTTHRFTDHHEYQDSDFSFVEKGDAVIMTEKDAVKCAGLLPPGVAWVLPINADLPQEFFAYIDDKLANCRAK